MVYEMLGLCNACEQLTNCFTLAYHVACLIVLYVVVLFCDDHHSIDVSRGERFSRSTEKWWLRCI